MWNSSETPYGERLLRSPEVARAAESVEAEVRQQLDSALHGPLSMALAAQSASDPATGSEAGQPGVAGFGALLNTEVPRRFIATGACLSAAYAALAAGDEHRVAGALLSGQAFLFPRDPIGAAAVAQAVATATRHVDEIVPPDPSAATGGSAEQVEAMQRTVAATVEALEHAFRTSVGHVQAAALGSRSWMAATGGFGPGAIAGQVQFGPFLDGLVRWAFYVEAALQGVRTGDWSRTGAALVAARQFVTQAEGG